MNDLVKYHNTINKITFNKFTEKELDIFFSIIYKIQDLGSTEIELTFAELKNLSAGDVNLPRFLKSVENVAEKISKLNYRHEDDDEIVKFYFFKKFTIKKKEKILILSVNDEFKFLVNNLFENGNFTMMELENFVSIKGIYLKTLYRLLKQWQGVEYKIFKIDELRALLNFPEAYQTAKFIQKVIKPAKTELKKFFSYLEIEKIKSGKTIVAIKFSLKSKTIRVKIPEDKIVNMSEELAKAFEKASKNRFIQPFLTDKGKSDLIEAFENEEALIRGLYYAYKTIKKEFKSLLYLTRVIETGAKEQKVVVKTVKKDNYDIEIEDIQNDNVRQTSFDELPKEKKKIEITEEEFEVLYKKYLEENNASDSPFVRKGFAMPYSIKKENAEEK